MVVTVRATCYS